MITSIKKKLKKNVFFMFIYCQLREKYYKHFFSDKHLIKKMYRDRLNREVNLENPKRFNDKLQWLKLNWHDPLAEKCVDKFKVRGYVREKIGDEYLNELYGVYESVKEIDINKLPKSFVLKATHGSGLNIICEDKNSLNWKKEFWKMRRWLRYNHFWLTREWPYKNIKPRIIAEKYLEGEDGFPPKDHKIFCFNGEPKLICVDFDKYDENVKKRDVQIKEDGLKLGLKRNVYDIDWNLLDVQIMGLNDPSVKFSKPDNFEKMIEFSKILSEPFPHVRVDFYNYEGNVLFGELTFFDTSGTPRIIPEEFEMKMGEWLDLPDK